MVELDIGGTFMSSKPPPSFALALITPVLERIGGVTTHDPSEDQKDEHVEPQVEVFDPTILHKQEPSPSRAE